MNETKLRYRNKELTNALVQADGLLQQMTWRIERGESMARAVAELRKADDVAFRAAVNVLVTTVLGASAGTRRRGRR